MHDQFTYGMLMTDGHKDDVFLNMYTSLLLVLLWKSTDTFMDVLRIYRDLLHCIMSIFYMS